MNGSRRWWLFAALAPLMAVFVACGDDGGGDVSTYCELSRESDQAEIDDDQLDELADAAPSEISDEVQTAVDELKDNSDEVFAGESEEFNEAVEVIEEFEAENCGDDASDASD